MAEQFKAWDSAEGMNSPEEMQAYLAACFEEDDGDGRLIAHALGVVARAGSMAQLARDTGISREGLYKALSGDSNPNFGTILKVTRALGLDLAVKVA
jgi:probable addiction module antidote protein